MSDYIPLEVVVVGEGGALTALPGDTPLGQALGSGPYLLLAPLEEGWAQLRLSMFRLRLIPLEAVDGRPLYRPVAPAAAPAAGPQGEAAEPGPPRPVELSEAQATRLAYDDYVREAASFLRAGLSVLIVCDKIVVPHLADHIVRQTSSTPRLLEMQAPVGEDTEPPVDMRPQPALASLRQRLLARLRDMLRELGGDDVLVITHLDLLGGGTDNALANETRDLIELLYGADRQVILAFADPSLSVPEVLASRFAVRMSIEGSPRHVRHPVDASLASIERALVTQAEADRFAGLDGADFYKYVVGLNPVRLRQTMRYALQETEGRADVTVKDLPQMIRKFKAQMSASFEIPDVSFADIGGYAEVKRQILRSLQIMTAARSLTGPDQRLRGELIPRGFIFHGEPGTGKTLFAKAIANELEATIQVVSGPEVTNKYVGESERRIRELFAEARRNAPSVIVFDEFDSIAASRTSSEDGGSRAGNAMVAQILTEMDGFRPDVQMIVIGTTNRLEIIDRALLRPSRFQSFHIGLPDEDARRGIIKVHARRYGVNVTGIVEPLIHATKGWNGDEIRALFRDAFVGERWEGVPAGAERIGELVGQQQRARREQQTSRAGR
ncbi:ATP-binding protein [Nonomuraea africana]|uniref:AAA+ superfamily predicted ATPase n=1 Tax=Nonomuraea africana TaxID=46171 RepID=A0ABR9KFF3_9ACTN|nr:ATP-binding protein [Nonomuraea africana]MBE1560734.1 AAA+ superfamily predicted ATPase [Nonomuraea africana]